MPGVSSVPPGPSLIVAGGDSGLGQGFSLPNKYLDDLTIFCFWGPGRSLRLSLGEGGSRELGRLLKLLLPHHKKGTG